MTEDQEISEEAAHEAKQKFSELHKAVLAAMSAEKQRLLEARALKARLDVAASAPADSSAAAASEGARGADAACTGAIGAAHVSSAAAALEVRRTTCMDLSMAGGPARSISCMFKHL